jgi:hypothetical protein
MSQAQDIQVRDRAASERGSSCAPTTRRPGSLPCSRALSIALPLPTPPTAR